MFLLVCTLISKNSFLKLWGPLSVNGGTASSTKPCKASLPECLDKCTVSFRIVKSLFFYTIKASTTILLKRCKAHRCKALWDIYWMRCFDPERQGLLAPQTFYVLMQPSWYFVFVNNSTLFLIFCITQQIIFTFLKEIWE